MSVEDTTSPWVPRSGTRLGACTLLERLGSGASGQVWAAAHHGALGFRKRVAIKLLRPELVGQPRAHDRMLREGLIGARVQHPNVRGVFGLEELAGRPYLTMSWADASLEELFCAKPKHNLGTGAVLAIGEQCCSALEALHGYGESGRKLPIVHGDLSPDNVLLQRSGDVLLSDFALAELLDENEQRAASGEDGDGKGTGWCGKAAYSAPERVRGERPSQAADVYSVGCLLFESLFASPPHGWDEECALICRILDGPPDDLSSRLAELPRPLSELMKRCLARDPRERPASAEALGRELRACAAQLGLDPMAELRREIADGLGDLVAARDSRLLAMEQEHPRPDLITDTLPLLPPPPQSPAATLHSFTPSKPRSSEKPKGGRRRRGVPAALLAGAAVAASIGWLRHIARPVEPRSTISNTPREHATSSGEERVPQRQAHALRPRKPSLPSRNPTPVSLPAPKSADQALDGTTTRNSHGLDAAVVLEAPSPRSNKRASKAQSQTVSPKPRARALPAPTLQHPSPSQSKSKPTQAEITRPGDPDERIRKIDRENPY